MKIGLVEYLACPGCRGDLALLADRAPASSEEIAEGALVCRACDREYPIRAGIPRFPLAGGDPSTATARTKRTYDFTWRLVGGREVVEDWEKDSYRYIDVIPPGLTAGSGKVGLDAGCGGGADLVRMARGGARLIGFDLSDGVESASRLTRSMPNVDVVQGDLNALPFKVGCFDFIYSFGALHHLPDPEIGFLGLARLLKPGAPLITYLYQSFEGRSMLERVLVSATRGVRSLTSRMPARLLYLGCWLAAPVIWLLCSVPAHLLRGPFPRLADRIPFRHTLRWPVLASDLFDRFAPPMEWRYRSEDVRRLYQKANLTGTEIKWYRGWVSWGFR